MKKYLVTSIDGYTLEVETFFLNADSYEKVMRWVADTMGDEAHVYLNLETSCITGVIQCDEHHMLKDSIIFVEPIENVKEVTI